MKRKHFLFLSCVVAISYLFGTAYVEESKAESGSIFQHISRDVKEVIDNGRLTMEGFKKTSEFLKDNRYDQEDWSSKDCPYSLEKIGIRRCFSDKRSMLAYLVMLNHCKEGNCWENQHLKKEALDAVKERQKLIDQRIREEEERRSQRLAEEAAERERERRVKKEREIRQRRQEDMERLKFRKRLERKIAQIEKEGRRKTKENLEVVKRARKGYQEEVGNYRYCTDPGTGRRWRGPSFRTCNCERINSANKASCFMSQGFRLTN